MSRTKFQRIVAVLLTVIMLASTVSVVSAADTASTGSSNSDAAISIAEINEILNAKSYVEYQKTHGDKNKGSGIVSIQGTDYDKVSTTADVEVVENYLDHTGSAIQVSEHGLVTWKFNVDTAGLYAIRINYAQLTREKSNSNSIERTLYINGSVPFSEARSVIMKKTWAIKLQPDGGFEKEEGKQPNDIRPDEVEVPTWTEWYLRDSDGYYANPYEFYFEAGENSLTLESIRESVIIESIELVPYDAPVSYQDYLKETANMGAKDVTGVDPIILEGEFFKLASDVTLYPVNDRVSAITSPQSADTLRLNAVGGEEWSGAGQWIEYEFDVEKTGYYTIALRFKQSWQSGLNVARRVYIDGEVPFEGANNCVFGFDNGWQSTVLTDGTEEFKFYLTEGHHTIRFEVTLGEFGSVVQLVSEALTSVNADYLEILKLTGPSPDKYQDYKFESVIPKTLEDMLLRANDMRTAIAAIGEASENTATLEQIALNLEEMVGDTDKVAGKLATLKSYLGTLGTWVSTVKSQPLMVDYIAIQPVDAELPRADANIFESFWFQIRLFVASFYVDYNNLGGSGEAGQDSIEVWVVLNREKAQIIRNLAENYFTPKSGVAVNVKLVAGGTLLPSVLAGVGPDVSLFEADPLEYAIRDAVMPLNGFGAPGTTFDGTEYDFDTVINRYVPEALTPVTLYGNTYGLPDSMSFPMLFYRKDILADLGLEVPKTWDELISLIPTLMANNMYLGMMNESQLFLYQNGGQLWADDGMRINYDSVVALDAFEYLCSFYKNYSLEAEYDFANRFRTGEMPIGIAAYTTCNQLSVFASELSGLWGFTALPGTVQADGSVNYDSLVTITSCMMLRGTENADNAWKFMCWYTDADFQIDYSNEVVATMGTAEKHNTANKEALGQLPWSAEEYIAIDDQMENLFSVTRYPGTYVLARYVNFAFLNVYNNNADPSSSLLAHVNTINKEINRKRTEFGLETLEIGQNLATKRLGQVVTLLEEGELKTFEGELFTITDQTVSKYQTFVDAVLAAAVDADVSKVPDSVIEAVQNLASEADGYAASGSLSQSDRAAMELISQYLTVAANALLSYR